MPHQNRRLISPPVKSTFTQVFEILFSQPEHCVKNLKTTGGVEFDAVAKLTLDSEPFISLPHNNRIYSCCWGNVTNHMGEDGQRIGHYSRPLDEWCQEIIQKYKR